MPSRRSMYSWSRSGRIVAVTGSGRLGVFTGAVLMVGGAGRVVGAFRRSGVGFGVTCADRDGLTDGLGEGEPVRVTVGSDDDPQAAVKMTAPIKRRFMDGVPIWPPLAAELSCGARPR